MLTGLVVLAVVQAALAMRIAFRMLRTGRAAQRITRTAAPDGVRLDVIVPVLDEERRLGALLAAAVQFGPLVGRITVVDGGSRDGTRALIAAAAKRDPRIVLVDAAPVPPGWNGKAWGLARGVDATDAPLLLTLDADVRPDPALPAALVAFAAREQLDALSVATRQHLADGLDALVHPAMLATLVYRFGLPGAVARTVGEVQANGQCFLVRREALAAAGGFAIVRDARAEDVTLARALVAAGKRVAFAEAENLIDVRMYASGRETWVNWPRSLPLRDRFVRRESLMGILEVVLVQTLPLPLLLVLALAAFPGTLAALVRNVEIALVAMRLGTLAGMSRAYASRPLLYWLSPLADLPVAFALVASVLRRRHVWRGRVLVQENLR